MSVQRESFSKETDWNKLYIDGEWVEASSGDTIDVMNPSTQEKFSEVPAGQPEDVHQAFEAAKEAQKEWGATPVEERVEILEQSVDVFNQHRPDIMNLLQVESGSSIPKSMGECEYARGLMEWMNENAEEFFEEERSESIFDDKENIVKHEPVGTVSVITPWNFPFYMGIRAVAPALVAGNAVVLKPATETPITGGLLIGDLYDETDLPSGLINVVTGKGSAIGDDIAGHPQSDVVAFTGSTSIGQRVARLAADEINLQALELGGNAPHIVLDDADVDLAVTAGLYGTFMHQGQVCISINRHLVHEDIYDEYVEKFATRAKEISVGDPSDAQNIVGPLINESQRDQIMNFIEESIEAGAELEAGGETDGLFLHPTVLSNCTNDMAASCNEHFGPVAPIIPFSSDEEAVEIANDTEYGLSSSVHSGDMDRARKVADQIEAGMVHINDQPIHDEPHMPFGGMKMSGLGRYNGKWVLEEFTETKWISEQYEPRNYLVF